MPPRRAARSAAPPDPSAVVRIGDPGELAAAVPQLLGFRPRESLVLISLRGPRDRVGLTVRVDLPPERYATELASSVVSAVGSHGPDAVVAVVVSEAADPTPAELPHRALMAEVTSALDEAGIALRDAMLVRGGRWWSYECAQPCCRPDAGTPLPGGVTELEVASVAAGVVVADDRSELAARLDGPPPTEALREACVRVARDRWLRVADVGWGRVAQEARATLLGALAAHAPLPGLGERLCDEELARVLWGLRDTSVRDWALRLCLGADAAAAEALWTECVRRAPTPMEVVPSTLLAVSAWLRGDGAMANIALERALAAEPDHELARLLSEWLAGCLPPHELRELIARQTPLGGGDRGRWE